MNFYARGLKTFRDGCYEDVIDAFNAIDSGEQAIPSPTDSTFVKTDEMAKFMKQNFDLDIDGPTVESVFKLRPGTPNVPFQDFKELMLSPRHEDED